MERQQFLREAVPLEAPRGIRDGETQQQCYSTPRSSPEQQHVARLLPLISILLSTLIKINLLMLNDKFQINAAKILNA